MAFSSPRFNILQTLPTFLSDVTIKNGYWIDIVTAEVRSRQSRELNLSDCPGIIATPGLDQKERPETFGGNTANKHTRIWNFELLLIVRDSGVNDDIVEMGEKVVSSVWHRLLNDRTVNGTAIDVDVVDLDLDNFERMEKGFFSLKMNIAIKYLFVKGDL